MLANFHADLLAQLAAQGGFSLFAGLDAAAGQAPLPGEDAAIRRHAAEQPLVTRIAHQSDDDDPALGRRIHALALGLDQAHVLLDRRNADALGFEAQLDLLAQAGGEVPVIFESQEGAHHERDAVGAQLLHYHGGRR